MTGSRPFGWYYAEPARNGVAPPKASRGAGYPMIGMGHLYGGPRLDLRSVAAAERVPLPPHQAEAVAVVADDLLFARRSLKWSGAGVCTRVLAPAETTVFESSIIRVRIDRSKACPEFIAYFFQAGPGRAAMESIIEQTAVAGIRSSDLKALAVRLPGLEAQRAIASVLGALDNKVVSDRALGQRLDAVVRCAFDRTVGHASAATTLGELGTVAGGGTPRSSVSEYWTPAEVPWVTPKDMTALDGVPLVSSGSRAISRAGLAGSSAKLVDAGTVLYTSRATLGMVAIAEQPVSTNQGFVLLTPRADLSPEFVLSTLRRERDAIAAKASGSTFLEVNRTNFKAVPCPMPSEEQRAWFDGIAGLAMRQISALEHERRTLTAIRDALLPKLVSGQIHVPLSDDPEEQVGAAVEQLEGEAPT